MKTVAPALVVMSVLALAVVSFGQDSEPTGAFNDETVGDRPAEQSEGSGQAVLPSSPSVAILENDPAAVARQYLMLSSSGNAIAVELVEPSCRDALADGPAGLNIMGARVRIGSLTVSVVERLPERVTVRYTAQGTLSGESLSAPLDVLGANVELNIDSLTIDDMTVTDDLSMVRVDERWMVSCR